MLISTKGRYAVRVMLTLATHDKNEYVTLDNIAKDQEISEKYLEGIVAVLSKAGLVESVRGKGGGYRLSRPAAEYTLFEILSLCEGSLSPVSCLECKPNPCARAGICKTLPVWQRLETLIDGFLRGVTLKDVLEEGETNTTPCENSTAQNGTAAGAENGAPKQKYPGACPPSQKNK